METYLMHYGVKGMKWGVRRYQNYDGTLTELGKKQAKYNRAVRIAKANGDITLDSIEKNFDVGLTEMITKFGGKHISGLTNGHDFDWKEVTSVNGSDYRTAIDYRDQARADWVSQNYRVSPGWVKNGINPDFGKPGTTQNCAKCSSTMELALRGYTFNAGRQTYPSSTDCDEFWWKGAKPVNFTSAWGCDRTLRGYGKRTSGTIAIAYKNGTGHKMHWTNDANGQFTIEDGQNGKIFSSVEEMCQAYNADISKNINTYRLDNCEPDWDHMKQDSVVRIYDPDKKDKTVQSKVWNAPQNRYVDTW